MLKVYAALTSQKTLVLSKDVLGFIHTNVAMLSGEEVALPKAENTREDLFKAPKALCTEAHVANDDIFNAPDYA